MKRLLRACSAAIAVLAVGCAGTYEGSYSSRHDAVSAGSGYGYDYYSALSPYGTWIQRAPYGWVWYPLDIDAGWRPYTVGRWAYTDWGWMWISDDPWGSIPYQYGRWTYDDFYGWLWVPGDVWAPAWVAWHYGDGWVGWAPLPVTATWQVGIGFQSSPAVFDAAIDPDAWCFVPARSFATTRVRVIPPSRNVTLLSRTADVTNYTIVNSRPAERGLSIDMIQRDLGRTIPKYQVTDASSPRNGLKPTIRGNSIQVFRQVIAGRSPDDRTPPRPPGHIQSRPPRALIAREDAKSRRFEQRMAQERGALQREQDRELRNPPAGVPAQELRRRHQTELQAQRQREQRERDAMKHRRDELQKQVEDQAVQNQGEDSRGSDQGRGHGRGRGRGRDRGDE